MKHYQQTLQCRICQRKIVIDITSIGSPHQFIEQATCLECAKSVGGKLLGDEVEELEFNPAENSGWIQVTSE